MGRYVRTEKLEDREELSKFVWPVADRYRVEKGYIEVEELGSETVEHPLTDPELFSSFARLGARGEPTEKKILAWVEEHGLLKREDEGRPRVYQARVNQAPMPVRRFKEEVRTANSAAHLHYALFQGGPEAQGQSFEFARGPFFSESQTARRDRPVAGRELE